MGFENESGSWWIIILFLFLFAGMGNNGFNSQGAAENYVLSSDFASLQRQIDNSTDRLAQQGNSIANGLCDGFYTQAQLINGVNSNITNAQINAMQNANAIQASIADVNYNIATNANGITNAVNSGFCNTNYNNATNTRDIIDATNASTQAILNAIQANKVEELQSRIAEQNQQINSLQLAASQQAQNNYLVNQLAPKLPVAAYTVPNPFLGTSCYCGCNS